MNHGALLTRKNSTGIMMETSHPSGCIIPFFILALYLGVIFNIYFSTKQKISCLLDIFLVSASRAWVARSQHGR